jgi:hypothetical protein
MPITSDNPAVTPATEEKTYPLWWLRSFVADAPDLNGKVALASALVRYRRDSETQIGEFIPPEVELPADFRDEDVLTLAERHPDYDAAIGAVLDNVAAIRAGSPSNVLALLEILVQSVGSIAKLAHKID